MEIEKIKDILDNTRLIFEQEIVQKKTGQHVGLFCSLDDVFNTADGNGHNCLVCNLQEDVYLISNLLEALQPIEEINDFYRLYIIALYLFTEKILEIKKIIGLPDTYKETEFEVFKTIKLLANFYKHPKAFILTHHPKYFFDSDPQVENLKKDSKYKIIDIEFLNKYYRGEDVNKYKNLTSELRNNRNVIVILPAIDNLTKDFGKACSVFVEIIKDNKAYREILNNLSTLENYFENEYRGQS